jgi:hypothetical protein
MKIIKVENCSQCKYYYTMGKDIFFCEKFPAEVFWKKVSQ